MHEAIRAVLAKDANVYDPRKYLTPARKHESSCKGKFACSEAATKLNQSEHSIKLSNRTEKACS